MLLKELAGYRSGKQSLYSIITGLIKSKKISLSKGSISLVINPKNKPYVYRVWYEDSGYDTFLNFLKKNSPNEHLVKLLSPVKKVNIDFPGSELKYVNYVKMEKLTPLNSAEASGINKLANSIRRRGYLEDDAEGSGWLDDSMLEIIGDIADYDLPAGVQFDLHGNNVMKRGKTLVIIDPFIGDDQGKTIVFDAELEEYGEE